MGNFKYLYLYSVQKMLQKFILLHPFPNNKSILIFSQNVQVQIIPKVIDSSFLCDTLIY